MTAVSRVIPTRAEHGAPSFRLPGELEDFLAQPGPRSLVIRGPPGTGKTTLALSLLEGFAGTRLLVTGRVPAPQLAREFPWLSSQGKYAVQIVDTTSFRLPPAAAEPGRASSGAQADLPHDVPLIPHALREAWGRAGTDGEGRRDLQWLPPALQDAWNRVEPGHPALIVIDSWDAFVEEYLGGEPPGRRDPPDRAELERILLRHVRRGTSHLVLVLEREDASPLDYLVDGIVATHWETFDGHLERWIRIPKLRGQRIQFQTYPFSLEGGEFHCVTPMATRELSMPREVDPDPRPVPKTFWPASLAFATAFGRPQLPGLVIIERQPEVPYGAVSAVVMPMIQQVLRAGGRVLVEPGPFVPVDRFLTYYRTILPEEMIVQQVRIISANSGIAPDDPLYRCLVPIPVGLDPKFVGSGTRVPKGRDFVGGEGRPGAPNFVLVSTQGLREVGNLSGAPYEPENFPGLVRSYLRRTPTLMVISAGLNDPLVESVASLATIHLRVHDRMGRPVLYGIRPLTHGHIMTYGSESPGHPYGLLQFV